MKSIRGLNFKCNRFITKSTAPEGSRGTKCFSSRVLIGLIVFVKHLGIKKPPDYGQEVTQMFSQRNNPYNNITAFIYGMVVNHP